MTFPSWLAATAALSDDALAELGNKGLIRRAQKIEVSLLEVAAKHVSVTCAGTDQIVVKLVPQGPQQAACPCPAAGVCVHVIAACLWARTVELPDEPSPAAGPAPASRPSAQDVQGAAATAVARDWATECEAARYAVDVVESLLGLGLSHLSRHSSDRLRGAAQRAKTGKLQLLSLLLETAAGHVTHLAEDRDGSDEKQALSALAQAWAAAHAVLCAPRDAELAAHLRGFADTEVADTGALIPLGVRWWTTEAGARGYTVYWWDQDNRRVETLTNGRAKGTDPGFTKSWNVPLLWGHSLETISNSVMRLDGAERDSSGQLKVTTRTKAHTIGPVENLDLVGLSQQVAADAGPIAVGFGWRGAQVQVIAVREIARDLLLDEVNQELVWSVVDQAKRRHELRVPAMGLEQNALTMLLAFEQNVQAIVVVDNVHPIAVFAGNPRQNLSLSLTRVTVPSAAHTKKAQQKIEMALEKVRSARTDTQAVRRVEEGRNEIERWAIRTGELLAGITATGVADGWSLGMRSQKQIDSLAWQADGLGLALAARSLRRIVGRPLGKDEQNAVAAVLRAAFVVERVKEFSRFSALEAP